MMFKILLGLTAVIVLYYAFCKVTNRQMLGSFTKVGMFENPNAEPKDQNLEVG